MWKSFHHFVQLDIPVMLSCLSRGYLFPLHVICGINDFIVIADGPADTTPAFSPT